MSILLLLVSEEVVGAVDDVEVVEVWGAVGVVEEVLDSLEVVVAKFIVGALSFDCIVSVRIMIIRYIHKHVVLLFIL